MGKSMKDKLKEMEEENHKEFRKQLIEDMYHLIDKWKQSVSRELDSKNQKMKKTTHKMEQVRAQIEQASKELKEIKGDTVQEVQKLKRGRSWKFYLCCYLFGLIGSLSGITLCGIYWPQIRSFFM